MESIVVARGVGAAGLPNFVTGGLRRMMRGMLQSSRTVTIVADGTGYRCGTCGLVLAGDLLEVSGHVSEEHGRMSFALEDWGTDTTARFYESRGE